MEQIYSLVRNIVVYLILVTIIMNLIGKSSYRKYISIFTGMVLILVIAKPILGLFNLSDTFNYYFNNNLFAIESKDYSDKLMAADNKGKEAVLTEYRNIIKEQIEMVLNRYKLYPSTVNVSLNTEESSGGYGMITEITIVAAFTIEDEVVESSDIKVDKIMINQDIKIDGKEEKEQSEEVGAYEDTKKKIREELSSSFQIKQDQIHITIQEG
ncbi:stage III sporulation protein AF [Anaerosporobacter sp.]|uniref:stage III sporulation protein AF n=1 Tax=Anaerosporobacter sp. TaxID=1872529 RepID=UPI00286F478C|nr:stage III sporulation protein AF [Anaerosporobacter sp.]